MWIRTSLCLCLCHSLHRPVKADLHEATCCAWLEVYMSSLWLVVGFWTKVQKLEASCRLNARAFRSQIEPFMHDTTQSCTPSCNIKYYMFKFSFLKHSQIHQHSFMQLLSMVTNACYKNYFRKVKRQFNWIWFPLIVTIILCTLARKMFFKLFSNTILHSIAW